MYRYFVLLFLALAFQTIVVHADVVVTPGDPFTGGIGYRWTLVGMDSSDSVNLERHVGALSFRDPVNFADPNGYHGWTHTSDWVQLELVEPANLSVTLSRKAGVPNGADIAGDQLFPAFALWQGTDNDDGDDHVFNNSGNFIWAEDLSFVGNMPNETAGLFSVTSSFSLPAGNYSLVLSGNPPGLSGSGRQGYEVLLSTTAVPEPSSLLLLTIAIPFAFCRKKHIPCVTS